MSVHSRPIQERIDWLVDLARRYSADFCSSEAYLDRKRYLAEHPTAIAALKCMDGRINLPVATNTPSGIIQPFRNLGGMFDLGWPHLGEVIAHYVQDVVGGGRRVLFIITYHYSKGDPKRGCAGFNFDTEAARAYTLALKKQFEHVFGLGTVYPIVCGFETDEDAIILHGANGDRLDMSALTRAQMDTLQPRLEALYPDMPAQMRGDLLPLLEGNIAHIDELKASTRELDIEHREWMICVGRGFEFLHAPNLALIIGPYSPHLDDPIRKAAGIIEGNMRAGRIPDDGFLLLASSPYYDIGADRARAEVKSRFLCDFAAEVIRKDYPALAEKMSVRVAVLNGHTRALERLDDGGF